MAERNNRSRAIHLDPDQNVFEFNIDDFEDVWTATEELKELPSRLLVYVDLEKMIAARHAGVSPWQVHQRALAGEYTQTKPYDLHSKP